MNKYLMEALDAYPYDLAQAYESLEYAMSYDDQCPHTLSLMGQFYADQFQDYEKAIYYFEEALNSDLFAIQVYPHYIGALMNKEDFEAAIKAIDFAFTLKGSDKGRLLFLKTLCFEYKQEYSQALKELKASEVYSFNNGFKELLKETKSRIVEKQHPKGQAKSKKKQAKKKKNKKRK